MALGALLGVLPRLRDASLQQHSTASDAELLERFVAQRDEIAFEVLLRRHGPMVFAVCLRVLRHKQDAEDAFQATFLVLAHKAAAVSPASKLAGWLHGVAHKTALKARYRVAHRLEVEQRVPTRSQYEVHTDANSAEVEAILDQEIAGLPDRYRLPIILCDLEGRLRAEVAVVLKCSPGTLSSRLTRGRRMLAERLHRRGVGPSIAVIALAIASQSAVLAESLILDTVPVVLSSLATGAVVGSAASPNVAQLATGVMKNMFLKKLQTAALAAVAVATASLALLASYPSQAAPAPSMEPVPVGDAKALPEMKFDVEGRLLLNRKVLKDMKCDIGQLDRIFDILEEADLKAKQKTRECFSQSVNGAATRPNPQAVQELLKDAQQVGEKEFKKAADEVVANILTPTQQKRLREIDLQLIGHEALLIPDVAKVLDISGKQKEELELSGKREKEDIHLAMQPLGGGGRAGGGGVSLAVMDKVVKGVDNARSKALKRAMAILKDEQKSSWTKLKGEPYPHTLSSTRHILNSADWTGIAR